MVAATKQVQSLVNRIAIDAAELKAISVRLAALRVKYQALSPVVTGTPLQGNLAALNTWADSLITLAAQPIAQTMIDAYIPTHRGDALDG